MTALTTEPATARPSHPFVVSSRDIWRIALPASLAFITEPLVGLIDITVVGRLGDPNLLGGLVLGALAFDILFSLVFFLRLGTAGLTAQAIGARDPDDGLIHFVRAALLGLVIGVGLLVFEGPLAMTLGWALSPAAAVKPAFDSYLFVRLFSAPFVLVNYALLGWFYGRAAAATGMVLQLLVNGANIVLSVLFVYGFGWGVPGVALAAVAGHALAAAAGLVLVARHFGTIGRVIEAVCHARIFDWRALRQLLALNRDLMIRSAALMSAFAYFTAQTSRLGEITLSSNAVLMQFLMVSAFFLDGQGQAAGQLCGKAVGANFRPAFHRALHLAMGWGLVVALILFGAAMIGGPYLIDLITTSGPVRAEARDFLMLAALTAFSGMPAFVMDGAMTGATLNTIIRNGMVAALLIYLAAALALQSALGVAGLWIALHVFFLSRAGIFWLAVHAKLPRLFAA